MPGKVSRFLFARLGWRAVGAARHSHGAQSYKMLITKYRQVAHEVTKCCSQSIVKLLTKLQNAAIKPRGRGVATLPTKWAKRPHCPAR